MKKYFLFLISHFLFIATIGAQGTVEDYKRAFSIRQRFTWKQVLHHVDDARWLTDDKFQYHLTDGAEGVWKVGQVHPDGTITLSDTLADSPLQKHARVTHPTSQRPTTSPVQFIANPSKRRHERHWMEVDDERDADPVLSPDSSLVAFIRNDNVWVAKPDGSQARALSSEGTLSRYFSSHLQWSPDGRFVTTNLIRPVEKRYVYYVESSPRDQLQPILHKQEYAKPGDELMQKTPYIFEVATGKSVKPAAELIDNQYFLSGPTWCQHSQAIRFEYNQRGHQLYRVYEMNTDGQVRTLIEERADTYVRYSNNFRRDLRGDSLILWLSERDGWPHLFSLTPYPSPILSQITSGSWCVRRVLHIDEEKGFIIFTGNGRNNGEDPYHIHYYRVNFDGSGLIDLTPEPAHHSARFNSSYTAFIDTYSTVDSAPVTVVRSTITPSRQEGGMLLANADLSPLLSAGWVAPEVFVAAGRDDKTPMWGIIQRPTHFDPSKKYPVIEYIYAGPGDSYTPKAFQPTYYYTAALVELGFIVVQLDAMGTSNRGKKFEEVCYKNLKDAGFPDRIAWIKAAAARYPYMDIERVGIYGCSAGGQESTAAVLFHGNFYKAAYSACGCHDNRMDKIWWNEQWMGYPVDSSYIECSNVENAYRLERPLMLVVGELDDNVDPASTMQMADALIRANKPFELVVIPGGRHTVGEAYGEHKRFDFFVKHLLGVDPPAWNSLTP